MTVNFPDPEPCQSRPFELNYFHPCQSTFERHQRVIFATSDSNLLFIRAPGLFFENFFFNERLYEFISFDGIVVKGKISTENIWIGLPA